jgi:hypothetical protein
VTAIGITGAEDIRGFVGNLLRRAAELRHQYALAIFSADLSQAERIVLGDPRSHRDQALRSRALQLFHRRIEFELAQIHVGMRRERRQTDHGIDKRVGQVSLLDRFLPRSADERHNGRQRFAASSRAFQPFRLLANAQCRSFHVLAGR